MHRNQAYDIRRAQARRERETAAAPRPARAPQRAARRAEKRFPRRRLHVGAFFGFIFVLIIAYIIGYVYHEAQRPEVSQMRVEMGVLARPAAFAGVIIRDEAVYYAPEMGALLFYAENHERVRAGRVVVSIQDAGAVEALRADLAAIDQGAVNTQRQRAGRAANEEEIAARNRAILAYVDNAAFGLAAGDVEGVFALGEAVRQSLSNRNQLYFSGEDAMAEYASAREQALTGITQAISQVVASHGGIFSNLVDGLENELNVNNLGNIPRELITGASLMPNFYSPEVAVGDSLFRIVRSNDWYIAAHVAPHYAENWSLNSTVTLFVEDGPQDVPLVTQVHMLTNMGGDYYVVFRTNNDLMRFIDRRNITFRLAQAAREGFKIPQTAIAHLSHFPVPSEFVFVENNVLAVNLIIGENVVTESISGSRSADGGTFYITADSGRLRVGDAIAAPGGDEVFRLETIEAISGVFVTNLGATQFRRVTPEANFAENADYIILDPARNTNLRLFDRIVADARAVSDRLLLH